MNSTAKGSCDSRTFPKSMKERADMGYAVWMMLSAQRRSAAAPQRRSAAVQNME